MATIHLTVYNDAGTQIATTVETLPTGLDSMDKIEAAVEHFRQQALPKVSKLLLEEEQKTFKKKWTRP